MGIDHAIRLTIWAILFHYCTFYLINNKKTMIESLNWIFSQKLIKTILTKK